MRRSAALLLSSIAVVAVAVPWPLAGQDPDLARLRAALAAAPDDPGARCSLAFGLVRAGEAREAVDTATPAITALRARADRTTAARLLGACLYNRGRAHEALGATADAIRDYADSVDARPNESVATRLRTLVPDLPRDAPGLAVAAAALPDFGFPPAAAVTRARTLDGVSWSFFASDRGEAPTVVAVARLCGALQAVEVDRGWFDNHGTLSVRSARGRMLGDVDGVVVEIGGAGDATCGSTDGVVDAEHEATAVVFADGCRIRVATFVTYAFVCDETPPGMRVRFDDAGNAITTARSAPSASATSRAEPCGSARSRRSRTGASASRAEGGDRSERADVATGPEIGWIHPPERGVDLDPGRA